MSEKFSDENLIEVFGNARYLLKRLAERRRSEQFFQTMRAVLPALTGAVRELALLRGITGSEKTHDPS